MSALTAIPTRYKGYQFRSRLEARWAGFFDLMGASWEYEPEGFTLPSGRQYLPDFRVTFARTDSPPAVVWFEVKPEGVLNDVKFDEFQRVLEEQQEANYLRVLAEQSEVTHRIPRAEARLLSGDPLAYYLRGGVCAPQQPYNGAPSAQFIRGEYMSVCMGCLDIVTVTANDWRGSRGLMYDEVSCHHECQFCDFTTNSEESIECLNPKSPTGNRVTARFLSHKGLMIPLVIPFSAYRQVTMLNAGKARAARFGT